MRISNKMATTQVLTIDGPGAAGKGSVSLLTAEILGWHILPSGLIYRHLAYVAAENGMMHHADREATQKVTRNVTASEKIESLIPVIKKPEFRTMKKKNGELSLRVLSNGLDITNTLMSDEIGKLAGKISAFAQVRKALVERQRQFREPPGLVAEGRDMGTSIFPDAFLKIFLTADLNVRAERRLAQLLSMGHKDATIESVLSAMRSRDLGDITRAHSPLKKSQRCN